MSLQILKILPVALVPSVSGDEIGEANLGLMSLEMLTFPNNRHTCIQNVKVVKNTKGSLNFAFTYLLGSEWRFKGFSKIHF